MGIKVSLEHRTTYSFDRRVTLGPHSVRLRPAPHSRTPIEAYSLTVTPETHFLNWQQDPFGNHVARLVFPEPTDRLEVTVGLIADLQVINPFDFFVEEYAERYPFAYDPLLAADLEPYLRRVDEGPAGSGPGPLVRELLAGLGPLDDRTIVDFLVHVNQHVHAAVAYTVRLEPGVQTPDETLAKALGSCRDSAWLMVSVLRELGLAARFVSGYLVQLVADQASLDGPSGPTADFTDLHAWTEVFVPGAGWVGLDPTSALFAGEGHIPLSATPHPSSAAPISGLVDPCEVTLDFSNVVTRFHEDPRVTKPYTRDQWQRIDDLGEHVDTLLQAQGLELTMGGEPTFVSIDDMESAQWNTAADGEHKRALATDLAARLQAVFGQAGGRGAVVQRSQGKWYPGEPLPRWQIALVWRADGVPLWTDPTLLADPWTDAPDEEAPVHAETLARTLTARLGLPEAQLLPAFEDPLATLVTEVRLPYGERPDGEPTPADVAGLDAAVADPTAWVLPLHPVGEGGWASPAWRFRRGRLVLTPGDSPAGLRLPLDAVSWADPRVDPEPDYHRVDGPVATTTPTAEVVDDPEAPRTAVVVEARGGHVHVFLPPLDHLEDFTGLLGLVERCAPGPVVIEGYGPPPDPRALTLGVTPDPGVIEVNLQPTSSWGELCRVTEILYDVARTARLGTEKFDLDGLHTGTGGGNHLTLGGPTPERSPMLRRPDLLVSLLTYWQHHPSLSYLFSGRFVGPTSQAPRADEGRPESLYELEIAFAEIERLTAEAQEHGDGFCPPWLVDRSLRHLLTDLTGNTHRAEFCIDKLYSPDSSRGRLGLLELRGFEMPPHAEMGLLQALLVRALVARCAAEPYTAPLVRWGTELHERFLLPYGAAADIADVVADLRRHGIAFEEEWFAPYLEFRFPRIGTLQLGTVELELRAAIEPWRVLGEEATGSGTARYVDSSVERVQVKVSGVVPGRHLVTCNGVPVPLTGTGVTGEQVAGVRYKAWQPWSALHPTIEVHSPLQFDVVDLAHARSLGGCTYHVVHPGGRSYDVPPVNASEAEARRASRFEERGFMTGEVDVAALQAEARRTRSAEYPHTLDLRRHVPRGWSTVRGG